MPPTHMKIDAAAASPELGRAADALAAGAVVAFPTETVYGVAVNAGNDESVRRLRAIKSRDAAQPFTVHVGRRDAVEPFVPDMSPMARRLIRKAWPGPLTLIFKVPDPTVAAIYPALSESGAASIYRDGTVGVRFPANEVASRLIEIASVPVVASSANSAGVSAPVDVAGIDSAFLDQVDFVIDSGPTQYRKASTIVALNGTGIRLLREGVWDERTVQRLARVTLLFVCTGNTCRSPMAAGLARKLLAERFDCRPEDLANLGIIVQSAGVSAWPGSPASPNAVEVCAQRGADISDHQSQPLTDELIQSADIIYGMTPSHLSAVRAALPAAAARAALLDEDGEIADPIGGSLDQYETAARQIEAALVRRLAKVEL